MVDFTERDEETLAARGISLQEAQRQLGLLQTPPPAIQLDRPCRVDDGIYQIDAADHVSLLQDFAQAAGGGRFSRFVPASGAASRMFKDLNRHLAGDDDEAAQEASQQFFAGLHDFAFYGDLRRAAEAAGVDLEAARQSQDPTLVRLLLETDGLGLRQLPKGLIPFHRGDDGRGHTAVEEHLRESAEVLALGASEDTGDVPPCRLHFTVPGAQQELCHGVFDKLAQHLEAELGQSFDITTSVQAPDTDTLALDQDGGPLRSDDGGLIFRPGGHGALIKNLRRWATAPGVDLVFVKNIDNMQPASRRDVPVLWKRLLGGFLVHLERTVVELEQGCLDGSLAGSRLDDGLDFLVHHLAAPRPGDWLQWSQDQRRQHLLDRLHRPLRVCGVVPNTGETGGGPFWVRHDDGTCSPQIVETSQIDRKNPQQETILQGATHFNPVDVVCRLRSRQGEVFALPDYVDPSTVFVAHKSHHGRPILALERPGLWNGAMAHWNTVFVEVPAATFAPVKSVFDLLKPEHQA